MAKAIQSVRFFTVGGTLDGQAASYVSRPADDQLLDCTLAGEYCNVLAARQTGKSSLMVRTAERLKKQGVRPVIIDLTLIGSLISASEWYIGLISYITRQLKLSVDEHVWWNARKEKSPVQRFSDFLHEVILKEISDPIVIFIDEIDSTLKLGFTDDFFAAIRAAYNARSQNEELKRLAFVLLGVTRPADLIKDRTRTPYNIGTAIDITDFQIEELGEFEIVLESAYPRQGRQILEWVLNWTGGQPYLTQKLCSEVVKQANGSMSEEELSLLVGRLFLGDMARTETNLRSIRDYVKNNLHLGKMLRIYKQIITNKKIVVEEQSIEQNELKLTGLVKSTSQGNLQVRNRIYAQVFNENWVKENMPVGTTQRLAVITSIIAVFAISVAGYFYYQQQNQTAEVQARTYIDNFNNSNSPEVKITSLAELLSLGGDYVTQAQELFDALGPEEQLRLFDLTTPANVGEQLIVVVEGMYQRIENTSDGNVLLKAMADALAQSNAPGAINLTLEINTWLDARDAALKGDYPLAISLYTSAFEYSHERENKNVTILMERASVYVALVQYDNALTDYDNVVDHDANMANIVQNAILRNQKLAAYWREHASRYPSLLNAIAVPTELSIPTSISTTILTVTPLPDEITDAKGVPMRLVPAGEFTMGTKIGSSSGSEQPVHQVYLDSFYMDKYEVTNVLYKMCVDLDICKPPLNTKSTLRYSYYGNSQFDSYPVMSVDWNQAKTYCEWRGGNLPTEAQWEKAARGTDGRSFPWGEGFDCNRANFYYTAYPLDPQKSGPCAGGDTTKVGHYESGKSPYGIYDLIGNVEEWVNDWYSVAYYQNSPSSSPQGPDSGQYRVVRGGSWIVNLRRAYSRDQRVPNDGSLDTGFRCVRGINP